ncbi:antitoxin AF2212-like protein [Thermococcus sp. JCM 11816]
MPGGELVSEIIELKYKNGVFIPPLRKVPLKEGGR